MKICTPSPARAFTLIELLIVVAIIAIITGSSMAVLTAPMFERVRAEDQQAFEAGAGIFFSSLVNDAHRAAGLQVDPGTTATLTFAMAPPSTGTIRYAVDDEGLLTRAVDGKPAAKIAPGIQSFSAEKLTTGSLWAVSITGAIRGYDPMNITTSTRRMDVLVGQAAWSGGGA